MKMTQREHNVVSSIADEGKRAYLEKINQLADVLGDTCDSEAMAKKMCSDIWEYLGKASSNTKYKKVLKRHGISIVDNSDCGKYDTGYDTVVVKDPGCTKNQLRTWFFCLSGWSVETFDEPRVYDHTTATDALEAVKRELDLVDLWMVVAERYKAIRKEIDEIDAVESDRRARKAEKQLERLKRGKL